MLKTGFLRFCDNPEIACCKAERELEQLRTENASLREQLAESQRREREAVEDILVAHSEGRCAVCKHKAVEVGASCKKWPDRSCFEWRGPQEAGKGEAE